MADRTFFEAGAVVAVGHGFESRNNGRNYLSSFKICFTSDFFGRMLIAYLRYFLLLKD